MILVTQRQCLRKNKMRQIVELFIRCIHLIAAIVWFGGVFFSTFIAMPIVRNNLTANALLNIHNRFRHAMRLTINILLLTGGIVIFIVAWNSEMQFTSEYMINSAAKFAAFGIMALFYGMYSSLYRRHLEASEPESQITVPRHINVFGIMTLCSGLIVFALALLLRN